MTKDEIDYKVKQHKRYLDSAGKVGEIADLGGADLTRANLAGADLTRANLTRADLTDADLGGADLTDTYLTGATLCGCNFNGATIPYRGGFVVVRFEEVKG